MCWFCANLLAKPSILASLTNYPSLINNFAVEVAIQYRYKNKAINNKQYVPIATGMKYFEQLIRLYSELPNKTAISITGSRYLPPPPHPHRSKGVLKIPF